MECKNNRYEYQIYFESSAKYTYQQKIKIEEQTVVLCEYKFLKWLLK